ncbi:MAG: FAD-binding oxidoreductase [Flavobacterium sp.]|nr:FAD-binding oxidoreductase [Flavobacterium sp.]
MHLSFWEIDTWFSNVDYTIVGSGIVGLNAALRLRERFPESKILILEKGPLPQGASTKNAGFACFGSLSEIVADLTNHSEQEVLELISKRWEGLHKLRSRLGDANIDFQNNGGYELFTGENDRFHECAEQMPYVNDLLRSLFKNDVFVRQRDKFGFEGVASELIFNPFESQIDTGRMMKSLLKVAVNADILILNQQQVVEFHDKSDHVHVALPNYSFKTRKLLFATNGFAATLTNNAVKPARAQVLITKPIPGLKIKGTFHIDQGYYYFRNIGDRILFGGGRNLDFAGETTTDFGESELIQRRLDKLLREIILPNTTFEIEHRWSGIMGIGESKKPIVERLSENVYCGVRLGGMGIAIGSTIGTDLANLV